MRLEARRRRGRFGRALTWLVGGTLALNLVLIVGLVGLIAWNGAIYFWQRPLVELELADGERVLGEVHDREPLPDRAGAYRIRMKLGNRDLTGSDFRWIDETQIVARRSPPDAAVLERLEWGNFYGWLREVRRGDEVLARGANVWPEFRRLHAEKRAALDEIRALERDRIGDVNYRLERARLAERRAELDGRPGDIPAIRAQAGAAREEYAALVDRLEALRRRFEAEVLVVEAASGERRELPVGHVVRASQPNALGPAGKLGLYAARVWEFVWAEPRESNTEGGIFPAIFGTVMMVFIMSFAVAPFGVVAAVYLQEYAREGVLVRLVRIAVNNLAGVPSIVFGVFGLGFFVYLIGGTIDQLLYSEALPTPTFGTGGILWASLTLALLTLPVVIVATEEGLSAVPREARDGSRALGATQFETLRRVVVPAAAPGIMTGIILAIARAAGEVAPLMIVGMVKLAPALPLDGRFPFVHLERKFMHLGFHIYDVGFQSPNVEAAKPLVFATALLLIAVVLGLNLTAIVVRNHLRSRYAPRGVG